MLLKTLPKLGKVDEQLSKYEGEEYRFLVEGNYKILYLIEADNITILIVKIFDTRQNPRRIMD